MEHAILILFRVGLIAISVCVLAGFMKRSKTQRAVMLLTSIIAAFAFGLGTVFQVASVADVFASCNFWLSVIATVIASFNVISKFREY